MKAAGILIVSLVLGIFIVTATVSQDVPQLINYQGKLIKDGQPYDGEVVIIFSIYGDSTVDAPLLWSETQPVTVTQGHYNVLLGSVTHFSDTVFVGSERYLGIKIVGSESEMTPRIRIASVGFALNADKVDGQDASAFLPAAYLNHLDASDGNPANAVYVDTAGNVGIGTTEPEEKVHVTGNIKTDNYFIGRFKPTFMSSIHDQDFTTYIDCRSFSDIVDNWQNIRQGIVMIKAYSKTNGDGYYYTFSGAVVRDHPQYIYLHRNPTQVTWKSFRLYAWH